MRLILSRKGFDARNGGCPSPIFPDGSLASLPIPCEGETGDPSFESMRHRAANLGDLVEDLTRGRRAEAA